MRAIKALPGQVLLVQCHGRDYHFQLSSRDETERWATNLVQLCHAAGHEVPGFTVLPREGEDGSVLKRGKSSRASSVGGGAQSAAG